ncbi:uncharacterized protein HD556DRAFT_1314997 [Suillus plorans]|uniref:Uncharacterized protein n=1 Tax=Suillus plorans TaxID=116603 RepID=A0A9P7AAD6_9AGAM|nr:uncharacterized protein HD556DRAFT_1314997 [Suillus plorans]KAG1784520.1 hypothetical protein HD556DRAFT_1314997 [Suillus plorans]
MAEYYSNLLYLKTIRAWETKFGGIITSPTPKHRIRCFWVSGLAGFGCGFSGLRRIMTTNVGKASGQSNIYAKVAADDFGSEVHVNKHEALRTMGKHVIALATTGASKTGWDTDRTSARENIGSAAAEMSGPLVKVSDLLEVINV